MPLSLRLVAEVMLDLALPLSLSACPFLLGFHVLRILTWKSPAPHLLHPLQPLIIDLPQVPAIAVEGHCVSFIRFECPLRFLCVRAGRAEFPSHAHG